MSQTVTITVIKDSDADEIDRVMALSESNHRPALLAAAPEGAQDVFGCDMPADLAEDDSVWMLLHMHPLYQPERLIGYTDTVANGTRSVNVFAR